MIITRQLYQSILFYFINLYANRLITLREYQKNIDYIEKNIKFID